MPMHLCNAPSAHGYGVPQVSAAKERSWYMTHMEQKRSCVLDRI